MGFISTDGQADGGGAGGLSINLHGLEHSPVGLWQFQGDLTDSSGNGYDLEIGAGTEQYVDLSSTIQALDLDGSTYARLAAFAAALAITGDMTIEALVSWQIDGPGVGVNTSISGPPICAHGASGEAQADNNLYTFGPKPGGGLKWLSESGNGTNAIYEQAGTQPAQVLAHVAATRESDVVTFWWNGTPAGQSGTLTTPTGGGSGRFVVGALSNGSSENPTMLISSLKLIASALTPAQIRAEFVRTLG
jgi:hypothetical protein